MKELQDKSAKRIDELSQRLQQIILKTYVHTFELAGVKSVINKGKDDYFFAHDYMTNQQVDNQLAQMARQMNVLLLNGIRGEWARGEDNIRRQVPSSLQVQATLSSRKNAANAFYNEKRGGLSISERVWNLSRNAKKEIEIIIQNGIKEGKSAAEISKSLRGYLNEPERLFRRVRNKETGELELSKAAQKYHPGRGVYRSAYKNAMRLARTEMKAAYHEAQWNAAQNNPLIVGWRIVLSNNHTTLRNGKPVPFRDICDDFVGEYPKSFKFHGWHPQCRCQMLPILARQEERKDLYRKVFDGKKKQWQPQQVKSVPDGFKEWIKKNAHRQTRWATTPYFIRDNFVDGQLSKGLRYVLTEAPQKIDPIQQELDALQYMIAEARSKGVEWGVNTSSVDVALSARNPSAVKTAIVALNAEVEVLKNSYNAFVLDVIKTTKEANKVGVDFTDVLNDLNTLIGNKAQWKLGQSVFKQRLQDLKNRITQHTATTELDNIIVELDKAKVAYNEVKALEKPLNESEIISRVGGGDLTKGSCSSLAFTYAGNKGGLDVLDFRDGESRRQFSTRSVIMDVAQKVGGRVVEELSDYTATKELFKDIEEGKEYYFACAGHAAIIRKTSTGFEYLELQSATSNGFKPLNNDVLKRRFGAKRSRSHYGHKYKSTSCLIDIDLLNSSVGFKKMLGYINTNEKDQKKGARGTMK